MAYQAVDVGTHPSYQRLGLFSRLNKLAMGWTTSRNSIIFNFPNFTRNSYAGYHKLGFNTLGSRQWLLLPVACRALFKVNAHPYETDTAKAPNDSIAWTPRALQWRFDEHPRIQYRRFIDHDGNSAIYSLVKRKGITAARVVMTQCNDPEQLYVGLSRCLLGSGVMAILYNGFRTPFANFLEGKIAKVRLRDGIHYCTYPEPTSASLASTMSFELSALDYA